MVWPHNNDIGKEKPKEPLNPAIHYWAADYASLHSIIDKDIEAIKKFTLAGKQAQEAKETGFVTFPIHKGPPKPKNNTTISMLDELMKEVYSQPLITHAEAKQKLYNKLYGKEDDPVLIKGEPYSFKLDDLTKPQSIPYKQFCIEVRVNGLPVSNKHLQKFGAAHILPESDVTESQLRDMIQKQFKAIENLIIDGIKKEQGLK